MKREILLKTIELVQATKAANNEALGDVAGSRAATFAAAVLAVRRKSIGESDQPLVLTGFGKFVPRTKAAADGEPAGPRRFAFGLADLKTGDSVAPRREQRAAAVAARKGAKTAKAAKAAAAEGTPGVGAAAAAKRAARVAERPAGGAGKGRPARKGDLKE
jgi:hypothetical protein